MSAGRGRKTACVTGGSGYIASALVKMLLEKGYAVKTTVRDPDDMDKNSHLKDLQALGPLEIIRAELDMEGSFDEAISGCDYAFLVAAPMNLGCADPERPDRSRRRRNSERVEVVRESRDGEARDPDVVGRRGLQEAATRRRARAGRDLLVRRRVPPSQQATNLGVRGVEGTLGEGGERVRGGEQHQPRHRAARVHLGRGAGLQGQNQRARRPSPFPCCLATRRS